MSDWYVDGSRPASGAGTSAGTAFRTLAEAAAVAKSADIISVGGGVYRETYAPSAGTVTVGDPDDRFVISGGEPLPELAPCVAGDEAILGPAWSSMWKATIAKTLLPGGEPAAGNLCEDGVQMSIASDRADMSETFFLTKPDNFHEGEAETSGSNVTGYRLRSVTDSYTKAQLDLATISFITEPNVGASSGLTFNASDHFLRMSGGPYTYEDNSYKDKFALFNLPAATRAGEWSYVEDGENVTIYVRPSDPANIAAGLIEYAARERGLQIEGVSNVNVSNFVVRQQGSDRNTRCPITIYQADNAEISNFRVENVNATQGGAYAAVFATLSDNVVAYDFEIYRAQGMSGFFVSGSGASLANFPWVRINGMTGLDFGDSGTAIGSTSGASVVFSGANDGAGNLYHKAGAISGSFQNGETVTVGGNPVGTYSSSGSNTTNSGDASLVSHAMDCHFYNFRMEFIDRQGFFAYTCRNLAVHNGAIFRASEGAHANTLNLYEQCRDVLIWGVNGQDSSGYATWQEGDGFVIAFCAFSASGSSTGGNRAIAQQMNIVAELPGEVLGWSQSAVLNCRLIPLPSRADEDGFGNSLDVSTRFYPDIPWLVRNNIFQGHDGEDFTPAMDWDYNLNTKIGGAGSGDVGPNDASSSYALNYTDAENGDFTYKADAPVRAFTGEDWSALIPGFKARWPQVPDVVFETDMPGDVIDWAKPPVGPTVDLDADYRAGRVETPTAPPVQVPGPPKLPGRLLRLSVTVVAP